MFSPPSWSAGPLMGMFRTAHDLQVFLPAFPLKVLRPHLVPWSLPHVLVLATCSFAGQEVFPMPAGGRFVLLNSLKTKMTTMQNCTRRLGLVKDQERRRGDAFSFPAKGSSGLNGKHPAKNSCHSKGYHWVSSRDLDARKGKSK